MSSPAKNCFLRCCSNTHPDILLPDGESVVLGRGPTTKIKDKRCSREQLSIIANFKTYNVTVTQLGQNVSSINGTPVGRGKEMTAAHTDTVEILSGEYGHTIIFDPPPSAASERSPQKKSDSAKRTYDPVQRPSKSQKMAFMGDLTPTLLTESKGFRWETAAEDQVFIMTAKGADPKTKIAAFDMDATLIIPKSGKVFPIDHHDWKILFAEVPAKLSHLHDDGFKVVVFTNQLGIAKGKLKPEHFRQKAENVVSRLGVPIQLFCCAADGGIFRKPRTGVWKLLTDHFNGSVDVDVDQSFYCGDAAGREKDWQSGKKKDFSCSDRLFALNLGLKFYTPEEFFLGQKATKNFKLPEFDPKSVCRDLPLLDPEDARLVQTKQEVILMVGIQGSGKSFFASKHLEPEGYVVLSNDATGGREKTLRLLDQTLSNGSSAVVDNTHGDKDTRKKFLDVVKKYHGVTCRCFIMATDHQHARHNNLFREITGENHTRIKEPLFNFFKSKYKEPALEEGFSEIVRVNFVPHFTTKEEKRLYETYLQEK